MTNPGHLRLFGSSALSAPMAALALFRVQFLGDLHDGLENMAILQCHLFLHHPSGAEADDQRSRFQRVERLHQPPEPER